MKVRERARKEEWKAVRVFTDRETPREAFWHQYDTLRRELPHVKNVHVLSFFGMGGMGKTRLLEKLEEELKEKLEDPGFVRYDFKGKTERREVLRALKTMLYKKYKFLFPVYELADYTYSKKIGEDRKAPEVQELSKQNPGLDLTFDILAELTRELVPGIGVAKKIWDYADKGQAALRNKLKPYQLEMDRMDAMTPDELYDFLPVLFAEELSRNLEQRQGPLVIFLDTYECLVNELGGEGEPLQNDLWLRGEDGLIQNTAGVLWVIGGREMLKWKLLDKDWEDVLETHLLEELSYSDCNWFLEKAGVSEEDLRRELCKKSKGSPEYLDLCLKQYEHMKNSGEEITADDFEETPEKLVARLEHYMKPEQKDLVSLLACLGCWNDSLLVEAAERALLQFSFSTYESIKGLSFVTETGAGEYAVNRLVEGVFGKKCPRILKERVAVFGLEKFLPVLQSAGPLEPRYEEALRYAFRFTLLLHDAKRDELPQAYTSNLQKPLRKLWEAGRFLLAEELLRQLEDWAGAQPEAVLQGIVKTNRSCILRAKGEFAVALHSASAALECLEGCLPENHPAMLDARDAYSAALYENEQYERALEWTRETANRRCAVNGETAEETLRTRSNLSACLYSLGRQALQKNHQLEAAPYFDEALKENERVLQILLQEKGSKDPETLRVQGNRVNMLLAAGHTLWEAKKLAEETYTLRCEVLGENHPETISSMASLANVYMAVRDMEAAITLYRRAYVERLEVLGEEHPLTLDSLGRMASALELVGRMDSALAGWKKVYETYRERFGDRAENTLGAAYRYANLLYQCDREEEAEALLLPVIEKWEKTKGKNHPWVLYAIQLLSRCIAKQGGRQEEVLQLRKESLQRHLKTHSPFAESSLQLQKAVCEVLVSLGRSEEAAAELEQLLQACRAFGEADPIAEGEILWALAEQYEELGRMEDAIARGKELVEYGRTHLPEKHSLTWFAVDRVTEWLHKAGRAEEARALEEEQYAVLHKLAEQFPVREGDDPFAE